MSPLSWERLEERGRSLYLLLQAGVSVDRLAALDRRVRRGHLTDWPGRPPGEERRQGIPDLDLADWREQQRRRREEGR